VYARKYNLNFYIKCDNTNPESRNNDYFERHISTLNDFGINLEENEKKYYKGGIIYQSEMSKKYLYYLDILIDMGVTSEKDGLISLDFNSLIESLDISSIKIKDILKHKINFNLNNSGYRYIPLYSKEQKRFLFHIPCVVDEYLMNISVSVRGEDKISVSPIQDTLRKVLGFNEIEYLHLPLLLDGNNNKRLKGEEYTVSKIVSKYGEEVVLLYLLQSAYNKPIKSNNLQDFIKEFDYRFIKKKSGYFRYEDLNFIQKRI
jgi:glutamyl/glutaminyl-tRNA synthetase